MYIFHFATEVCIYDHVFIYLSLHFYLAFSFLISFTRNCGFLESFFVFNTTKANSNCYGTCLELPECKTLLPIPFYNLVIIKAMQFVRLFYASISALFFFLHNCFIVSCVFRIVQLQLPHIHENGGHTRVSAPSNTMHRIQVYKFCNWQTMNGVIDADVIVLLVVVTRP